MYSGNLNPCIDTISQGTKKEVYLPLYYYLYCRGEVNPLYELFTISYDTAVVTPVNIAAEPVLVPACVVVVITLEPVLVIALPITAVPASGP